MHPAKDGGGVHESKLPGRLASGSALPQTAAARMGSTGTCSVTGLRKLILKPANEAPSIQRKRRATLHGRDCLHRAVRALCAHANLLVPVPTGYGGSVCKWTDGHAV